MAPPLVVTLGDLLLDVVCRVEAPIADDTDTPSRVTLDAGGQAANVAAWARRVGVRARLIARLADDASGRLARERTEARGVEIVGPQTGDAGGTVVVLVRPDGARDMLTDRGGARLLSAVDIQSAWLEGAKAVHITGYALAGEPMHGAAIAAATLARATGAIVSIDCAGVALIDQVGAEAFRARIQALGPSLVLGTAIELERLGGIEGLAKTVVEKRGPEGVVLHTAGSTSMRMPAAPAEVVDTTGAGDALAGGLLARLATGMSPAGCLAAAVADAALCVASPGAMPALH